MIGISTSMFSNLAGEDIVKQVVDLGFTQLELNFLLTPEQVKVIVLLAAKEGINISSLHNFVPEPPQGERAFMLSDIDQDLRRRAVQLTKDTILLASDVGASAVVLHMGQPRGWDYERLQVELREMIQYKASPDDIETLRQRLILERKGLSGEYLDSMLRSLDDIIILSDNLRVGLGVENRYHYGAFPNFEELGVIFQEFSGSRLGYWHDCGHAHHFAYCGLGAESEGIEAFKDLLLGIHLHDASLWQDHRLPSADGDIDFGYLGPYIKPDTILNLEPARGVDLDKVRASLEYLASLGIV